MRSKNAGRNAAAICIIPRCKGSVREPHHPCCKAALVKLQSIEFVDMCPVFEGRKDIGLDFLVFWPYDEGGCGCEKCQPWGCNGFLRLSRSLAELGREYFPNLQTVLSTWMFDTPPEGEWLGLSVAMKREAD